MIQVVEATGSDDEELLELYRSKIEELNPNIRYCAYNIEDSGANVDANRSMDEFMELRRTQGAGIYDLDSIIASQTKQQQQQQTGGETLEWRDRKINLRIPEKVRLFLLSVQDLDKSIEQAKSNQAKIDIIEAVLIDCKDSIQAVREEFTKAGATLSSNAQYLLAYLSYIRLIRTVERNLYLVADGKRNLCVENAIGGQQSDGSTGKKIVRPQNLTRLYEIIAQNIVELQQIAGLETDAAFQDEIKVLSVAFKAFRCYYIALTLVTLFRWKEAVALYHREFHLNTTPFQSNLTFLVIFRCHQIRHGSVETESNSIQLEAGFRESDQRHRELQILGACVQCAG